MNGKLHVAANLLQNMADICVVRIRILLHAVIMRTVEKIIGTGAH